MLAPFRASPFRRALSALVAPAARQSVAVRVPATSANMGPGYDCLGLALGEYNVLEVERATEFGLDIVGEGTASLPRDQSNYYYRAFVLGYEASAVSPGPVPPVALTCTNAIPPARGMGSSSACLVAGVSAGFALNGFDPEDAAVRMRVYQICAEQEGHPDNVAPAIYGGLQLSFRPGPESPFVAQRIPIRGAVTAVLFVPDFELPTKEARALLKDTVLRTDAVHNISRAAMLVHAFSSGQLHLLRWGSEDALHQPQRGTLFPLQPMIDSALAAGAAGAWLSGAGPTICAVVSGSADGQAAEDDSMAALRASEVAAAFERSAREHNMPGRVVVTPVVQDGVELIDES